MMSNNPLNIEREKQKRRTTKVILGTMKRRTSPRLPIKDRKLKTLSTSKLVVVLMPE
jgi:hypothetical protein